MPKRPALMDRVVISGKEKIPRFECVKL